MGEERSEETEEEETIQARLRQLVELPSSSAESERSRLAKARALSRSTDMRDGSYVGAESQGRCSAEQADQVPLYSSEMGPEEGFRLRAPRAAHHQSFPSIPSNQYDGLDGLERINEEQETEKVT